MRKLILLFFLCVSILSLAQKNYNPREQRLKGVFIRQDAQKLALKITKNANSDEEKVELIHGWITNNIKYDFRKLVAQNYDRDKTNTVLRRRKAICLGYADLFNELCGHVGIVSVMVPGYVKTIDTDICDSFYLDEHAWNAVKIDDYWYLMDNTWDAGYVRWYKKTVPSKIANLFHIPYVKFKYSPKFVFAPHKTYYKKSGHYFSFDHLSSAEMWQFMEEPMSIADFQNDSSFYYQKVKNDTAPVFVDDSDHLKYYEMSDYRKAIYIGEPIYDFNLRNHYSLGGAYFLLGQKQYIELKEDESTRVEDYEEARSNAANAMIHADSNAFYLEQQYRSLVRNNKDKIAKLKAYNKRYSKYVKKNKNVFKSANKKLRTLDQLNKSQLERKEEKSEIILSKNTFREKEFKHRFETVQDSVDQEYLVDSLEQLFSAYKDTIETALLNYELQRDINLIQINNEIDHVKEIHAHFVALANTRLTGFDDYDYPIRKLKQEFTQQDSFLWFNSTTTVLDSLKRYHRNTVNIIKQYHKHYSNLNKALKGLKKMHHAISDLDERWRLNTNEYIEMINLAGEWHVSMDDEFDDNQSRYKTLSSYSAKVLKVIEIELDFFYPNEEIKKHYKGLKSANKHLTKISRKIVSKCDKEISKLENR
jgi:hypothetical protein